MNVSIIDIRNASLMLSWSAFFKCYYIITILFKGIKIMRRMNSSFKYESHQDDLKNRFRDKKDYQRNDMKLTINDLMYLILR
jgi:hypothetical protein